MRAVGVAPSWPRELKGTLGRTYGVTGTMLKVLSPFPRLGFSRQDFWEQNVMIHLCRNLKGSLYLERCIAFLKPLLHQDGENRCRKIQRVAGRGGDIPQDPGHCVPRRATSSAFIVFAVFWGSGFLLS